MSFSEIIRFVLPANRLPNFARLRNTLSANGGVKSQYFGKMIAPERAAMPFKKDEICWVIQWPLDSTLRLDASFRSQLSTLTEEGQEARSMSFQFNEEQMPEMIKALEAPVCEFAAIKLATNAPMTDPEFKHSMNKTFTDCYFMDKFTGGAWTYSLNSNDTSGLSLEEASNASVKEEDRRLACYYVGWETIEAHQAASKTELFAEELDRLVPWFGLGSGAWYVKLEKHI